MANLLDTIRQNTEQLPQQGMTDQGQGLAALLRAKSGKAVAGPDVAASNLGEAQAVAQTNQTMQNQVQPAAQLQNASITQGSNAVAQQQQEQLAQIGQARQYDTLQTRLKTNQVLGDLERNKGQVDAQDQAAQVAQVAQNLRLQNQQYVDNLKLQGQTSRLNDSLEFKQNLQQSILGDNQEILEKQLGDKSILNANANEWNKAMSDMQTKDAWDMFDNTMAVQKKEALWSALGVGGGAAAGMAANSKTPNAPSESTQSSNNLETTSDSQNATGPGMEA